VRPPPTRFEIRGRYDPRTLKEHFATDQPQGFLRTWKVSQLKNICSFAVFICVNPLLVVLGGTQEADERLPLNISFSQKIVKNTVPGRKTLMQCNGYFYYVAVM
jgi:hypothetical protein